MTPDDDPISRIAELSAEMDAMVYDLHPASPEILAARRDRLREIEKQLLAALSAIKNRGDGREAKAE